MHLALVCCSVCGAAALASFPCSTQVSAPRPSATAILTQGFHARGSKRFASPYAVADSPEEGTLHKLQQELATLSVRARRSLYTALEPFDKGDFRWEFLVPWTTK